MSGNRKIVEILYKCINNKKGGEYDRRNKKRRLGFYI